MASEPQRATPYPDLNAVLEEFVAGARSSLRQQFVGAYLQGSFAVGDFDEHSDVDLVVVCEAEPDPSQVNALQTTHDRLHGLGSGWARHLEGSYFPREVLRRLSCRGAELWYLDNGARQLIRSDHCNTLVVRRVLRDSGITLSGPTPDTLVEPIPDDLLAQEMRDTMTLWGRAILRDPDRYRNNFYQGYIVLNFCRMLHDLRRRLPGSKRAGAEWARRSLDPSWTGLIDGSWSTRADPARSVRTPRCRWKVLSLSHDIEDRQPVPDGQQLPALRCPLSRQASIHDLPLVEPANRYPNTLRDHIRYRAALPPTAAARYRAAFPRSPRLS